MSLTPYWIGRTVVVDWTLVDLAGAPVTGATVTAGFIDPTDTNNPGSVLEVGAGLYRASFPVTVAGWWAFRLEAAGTATDVEQGQFYVRPDRVSGPANTYDPTTDAGYLRLLISDVDVHDPERCIFDDAEVDAFLARNVGVKRAAAAALDAIATNALLVDKVMKTLDRQVDAAKVSAEMRLRAAALRAEAVVDEDEAADGGGVTVIDFNPYGYCGAELAE